MLTALLLGACATPPPADDTEAVAAFDEANDPLEPLNRTFFEFNLGLDKLFIRPFAEVYRDGLPFYVRDGVRNFDRNLSSGRILANDLIQGNLDRAEDTLARFVINSSAGLGGVFDIAGAGEEDIEASGAIPYHDEDFGQTLAVSGVGEGPYLVLPILGPAPPRDLIGRVVDIFLDPVTYIIPEKNQVGFAVGRYAITGLDARSRSIETLDEIERSSIDFYAAIRSLYRQRRAAEIRNGAPGPEGSAPNMSIDLDDLKDDKSGEKMSSLKNQ